MKVLVTGAMGNVGRHVVRALLTANVPLRAAGRGPPDLESVPFDFLKPETWDAAIRGCDRLFLLRPPPISDVEHTLHPFIDRARAGGIEHIVLLSVEGDGKSRVVPHYRVEHHLARRPADHTVLRAGFFAQNLGDAYRRDIDEDDRIYVPAGNAQVAFVDTRDLGEVAAKILIDPAAHRGAAYTCTGAATFSFADAARFLTETRGKTTTYVPASVPGYIWHLHRRRLPAMQAVVQTVLHVGLRFGQSSKVDPTLEKLLGRVPRGLGDYIRHTWGR